MVKYYTREEVAVHNYADDCWVIIFDQVYNITELIRAYRGILSVPLLDAAGGSISHWFNMKTGDVKTYIDPIRNIEVPYTPSGRFIHVPPPDPEDRWEAVPLPWWKDAKYIIGKVTAKTMKIKVTNMQTRSNDVIKVAKEETLQEIQERYFEYNLNASSYTWKVMSPNGQFTNLKLDLTLEQNGIPDESDNFLKLGMDEDFYLPNLLIYYNDDLHDA